MARRTFNIDALNDLLLIMSSMQADMQAMKQMQAEAASRQEQQGNEIARLNVETIALKAELVKLNARMAAGINVKTVAALPGIIL